MTEIYSIPQGTPCTAAPADTSSNTAAKIDLTQKSDSFEKNPLLKKAL